MNTFDYSPGATPLNPEELDGLKLKHITTRAELDRWEQENIQEALAWLVRRHKADILDENLSFSCTKRCLIKSGDGLEGSGDPKKILA